MNLPKQEFNNIKAFLNKEGFFIRQPEKSAIATMLTTKQGDIYIYCFDSKLRLGFLNKQMAFPETLIKDVPITSYKQMLQMVYAHKNVLPNPKFVEHMNLAIEALSVVTQ